MIDIVFHPDRSTESRPRRAPRRRGKNRQSLLFNAPWARNSGVFRLLPAQPEPAEKTVEPMMQTLGSTQMRY
ncbi:MAG: hypothetical protein ACOCZE_07725 [Planctomycetota bacterium]